MEGSRIEKANLKGTPQYEEWLRKFKLKVNKKDNDVTNRKKTKNGLDYDSLAGSIISESITAAGPTAEIIANVLTRASESDAPSSTNDLVKHQILALNKECNDSNYNLEDLDSNYIRALDYEGSESKLYLSEDNDFIIKVQDWAVNSKTPMDYLTDRIVLHNAIFPNTSYELFGFGFDDTDKGKLKFILTQPFICGRPASLSEISDYMTSLGFTQSSNKWIYGTIEISDLNPRNVLIDENNVIYVIDEIIHIL